MNGIIPENNEQIKQMIVVELERARLAGAFYLPAAMSALSLAFGLQQVNISIGVRWFLVAVALIGLAISVKVRIYHLANARNHIKHLET